MHVHAYETVFLLLSLQCASAFIPGVIQSAARRVVHHAAHVPQLETTGADAPGWRTLSRRNFVGAGVLAGSGIFASRAAAALEDTQQAATTLASLNKKSTTPAEVLSALRSTNRFAPYASVGTAIVTGGNTGIGLETVKALASSGMNVIMCSRRVQAGLDARETLPEALRSRVAVQKLDLSDMQSVRDATNDILKNPLVAKGEGLKGGKGIDLIVNNAGVIGKKGDKQYSAQGLDLTFAINHVGHHMLTRDLLPSVNQGGRVVTVASTAHFGASAEKAIAGENGYSGSKLCNILFAKSLQDRLDSIGRSDVRSVSLHPGVIATSLFDGTGGVWQMVPLVADRNTEQGASTTTLCSLADNEFIRGGEFYSDCSVMKPSAAAIDARGELRERLWTFTETAIATKGFKLPAKLA